MASSHAQKMAATRDGVFGMRPSGFLALIIMHVRESLKRAQQSR